METLILNYMWGGGGERISQQFHSMEIMSWLTGQASTIADVHYIFLFANIFKLNISNLCTFSFFG